MMKLVLTSAALLASPILACAEDLDEIIPCKFKAHTTIGTVSGTCTIQQLPAPGFTDRWKLILKFNAESVTLARQLKTDQFCDMVRAQSAGDGSDIISLTLWGDLRLLPAAGEYRDFIKSTAPLYETRPNLVTVSQTSDSPLMLALLFEEPVDYFDPVRRMPSEDWWSNYLQSYYRLGTNRPAGFH
jgi:hypothetical protein